MNPTSTYCDAEHESATQGCFGKPDHEGRHWCWGSRATADASLIVEDKHYPYDRKFFWDTPAPEFTQADYGVLMILLDPVKQFFPELSAKIEAAHKAAK